MDRNKALRIFGNTCYWSSLIIGGFAAFTNDWFLLGAAFMMLSIGFVLRVRHPDPNQYTARKFWIGLRQERELMREERKQGR